MLLIDLLRTLSPTFSSKAAKVHLAVPNEEGEDPYDELLSGNFERWQKWQSQKNFERKFVVSLIKLKKPNHWLFAGVYQSCKPVIRENRPDLFFYDLEELEEFRDFKARLVVKFSRPGRQSYLLMDKWEDLFEAVEWKGEAVSIGEFPGFKKVLLSRQDLQVMVRSAPESWRTALSSVAGVYLISDTVSGKLYVGSATGGAGIWQRWVQYADTGHGGNVELIDLMNAGGTDRLTGFRYSILEIADVSESPENMRKRESHWKEILMTRMHGFNSN
ncbi:GIY-YIG nuclease family protein [Pseudomonas oryzae]|uniref:GIY-YIG catalytic domain-containing protein n=1 Tax=Pseudomonas oryzae TaxID=1392877 RepID=A0A1H1YCQ5_9PSED|nr:GIY-YIG nuclease family protein [Pseudomonas oryzae]SDT18766.1 hypothetical protein SAMN05216221_3730 [Pseudomonas oryzae]